MNDMSSGAAGDYYVENNKLFREYYASPEDDPAIRASG
jgi:hypothetical protein